ncbi:hypothetical protein BV349_03816 [Pseudomonas syringae pv. actinidiae]|uniref:hypothetical protein n=1 Tax=Pseudomonas syringae TaxID=317 RepID=UPI000A1E305D|nr:hypothetical protein [Pseudomonas syringae]OSN64402.1 hypothetical protein BV349_03816 [Pseudomonas syringae pv. actinidiae]OSN74912.1 hypothetical protein BV351_04135 [Pseudomonas syringae pv. actinidiae]
MSNPAVEPASAAQTQSKPEVHALPPSDTSKVPVENAKNDNDPFLARIDLIKPMMYAAFILAVLLTFATATIQNAAVYRLDEQTIDFLSQAFNAIVLLTIPLVLGAVGALTRLLLSGIRVFDQLPLVAGSGLMACFSWISIKSGVLVSVIAPHLATHGVETKEALDSSNSFYTMAMVAVLVGMFSTNLYLFITQRVEQLSSRTPVDKRPRQ